MCCVVVAKRALFFFVASVEDDRSSFVSYRAEEDREEMRKGVGREHGRRDDRLLATRRNKNNRMNCPFLGRRRL